LRQQRAMKTSILVNCPWGSARTCRMAPVHFRPPIAGPVLSPHVRAPLPSQVGPSNRTNNVQSRELPSRWTAVGPARPRRETPIHFRMHSAARFEFSPRARAGPEAAVVDDEGVGFPGELIRPSCCHPPPRSSPHGPWSLFPRPRPV
jgi:hypothetical protein